MYSERDSLRGAVDRLTADGAREGERRHGKRYPSERIAICCIHSTSFVNRMLS